MVIRVIITLVNYPIALVIYGNYHSSSTLPITLVIRVITLITITRRPKEAIVNQKSKPRIMAYLMAHFQSKPSK